MGIEKSMLTLTCCVCGLHSEQQLETEHFSWAPENHDKEQWASSLCGAILRQCFTHVPGDNTSQGVASNCKQPKWTWGICTQWLSIERNQRVYKTNSFSVFLLKCSTVLQEGKGPFKKRGNVQSFREKNELQGHMWRMMRGFVRWVGSERTWNGS